MRNHRRTSDSASDENQLLPAQSESNNTANSPHRQKRAQDRRTAPLSQQGTSQVSSRNNPASSGPKPSDPHQLRFMQPRALGRKVSDEFTVPLCRTHHRAVHRIGDERTWWTKSGINPTEIAQKLWLRARGTQPDHVVENPKLTNDDKITDSKVTL